MQIALLQTDPQDKDVKTNIARAESLMQQTPEADLYVLPEMWATGFLTDPAPSVHEQSMRALAWMQQTALDCGHAVAGSLAVMDEADSSVKPSIRRWRNRFFFVHPDGHMDHYDKRHLFAPGLEDIRFNPGQERVVVGYRGARILLQTCFDLRFPETSRNSAPEAYDLALYTASWPEVRQRAWDVLLPARAVENQAFVVGVNSVGHDGRQHYAGGSAAYDAQGHPLCPPLAEIETSTTVSINLQELHDWRKQFPVLP